MKTDTSAKKIILLLIGLNITTILASAIIFSFQQKNIVNASAAATPSSSGCTVKSVDLSKTKFSKDNPTYAGKLTTNTGASIASFSIQFTGTPGNLTKVQLLNITKQQVPSGIVDFVDKLNPTTTSGLLTSLSFGVTDPDGKPATLLLFNAAFHNGKNRITGSWIITDTGGKIDQYNGLWDVTLQ